MGAKQPKRANSRHKTGGPKGKAPAGGAASSAAKRNVGKSAHRTRTAQEAHDGIHESEQIEQVVADLKPPDKATVRQIMTLLEEYLGSGQAARLWLVTKSPEIGTSPLAAIAEGKAQAILAILESRWGPSPTYA